MRNASGTLLGTTPFRRAKLGAGGYVVSGDIADDGVMVANTDTINCFFRNPTDTEWTPVFRYGTSPALGDLVTYLDGQPGGYASAICATNSQVMYFAHHGFIWKSTNGGTTVSKTSFAQRQDMHPNLDADRASGPFMRVDPHNANVVIICPTGSSPMMTTDGGTNWSTISSIPAPSGGRNIVGFDRSVAPSGGKSQTIYIYSAGSGLYKTTNAGTNWSLVSGTPTGAYANISIHPTNGVVYLSGNAGNDTLAKRLSGSTWTTTTGTIFKSVVCKPGDTTNVWAVTSGGRIAFSTDGGNNFFANDGIPTRQATDVPWLAWTQEEYMSHGWAMFHPTLNRIYFTQGIGVWYRDNPPLTEVGTTWTSISAGIDQLCSTSIKTIPATGRVLYTCQDRAYFVYPTAADVDKYPSRHGPFNTGAPINHGTSLDYAVDDNNFLVGCSMANGYVHYSTDGGITWKSTVANPAAYTTGGNVGGGNVACGNKGNFVYLPTGHHHPVYTTDYGSTWTPCNLGGYTSNPTGSGWHHWYTVTRACVVADKNNAGHFYMYNAGADTPTADSNALLGIWKTTNGGANWTRIKSTHINARGPDAWHGKLKQVPGHPGHFWWTSGQEGSMEQAATTTKLFYSTDSCVTWAAVSSSPSECYDYDFGKAKVGASYPAIYCHGHSGGTPGIFRCLNFNPATPSSGTWEKLADYPLGNPDNLYMTVAADMTKFGRLYTGFYGSGFAVADYSYKLRMT